MNQVAALIVFVIIAFVLIISEKRLHGKKKVAKETVIAKSRKATLIRDENGEMFCICPYLCLATHEECEFADWKEKE